MSALRLRFTVGGVTCGVGGRASMVAQRCTKWAVILGLCTIGTAGPPTFYLSPGPDPDGDLAWQAAIGGTFTEFDLDGVPPLANVDTLSAGSVTVDVGLAGVNGVSPTAKIFQSAAFTGIGTVFSRALLNSDASSVAHSEITFDLSEPRKGLGLWVFDDGGSFRNSSRLIVTDGNDDTWTSPILESGNGLPHAIEGFIGVASECGVKRVALENLSGDTGLPVATGPGRFVEVDHIQVADALDPNGDADGDGLDNAIDACLCSNLIPTIVIGDNDTGVENELMDNGCSLADLIDDALSEDPSTAEIVQFLVELKAEGIISGREMGAILQALNT